jgi:hypothetical protein
MAFIRREEDFVCAQCGTSVAGTGYTNHCPNCLWSKHVDIDPGDRAHTCGGMMRPIALEGSTPTYRIVHRCEKCGAIRRVTADPRDSAEALVALSRVSARGVA